MNKINLSADDFIEKEVFEDIIGYEINKKLKIMGKIFDKKSIKISIAIELKLVECISLINNYMQWLDNGLLNVFVEYITKDEEIKIGDNYRELIISKVIIQIDPSEDIVCIIHFEKNEYISIMEIRNKNIQFVFSV